MMIPVGCGGKTETAIANGEHKTTKKQGEDRQQHLVRVFVQDVCVKAAAQNAISSTHRHRHTDTPGVQARQEKAIEKRMG